MSEAARVADEALAASPPGIVLIGNSKARTDFDPIGFGSALTYARPVLNFQVHASSAPAWYAFLEQRVYAGGHQPELILIYGSLAGMLATDVAAGWDRARLEDLVSFPSAVLETKVYGGEASGLLSRARQRGTALRTSLLDTVRDAAVGVLLASPTGAGRLSDGAALAAPALDAVFGEKAELRSVRAARAVPVVEEEVARASERSNAPEATLLPDLVAIATAHGARIVFVREPLPAGTRHLDFVPPEQEKAALELINHMGAGWIDLRGLSLPADAWNDDLHMSKSGRAVVTQALADALLEADVLGGGALPPARAPVAPTSVKREGSVAPLNVERPVRVETVPCEWSIGASSLAAVADDTLVGRGFGHVSPVVVSEGGVPLAAHAKVVGFGQTCSGSTIHKAGLVLASPGNETSTPVLDVRLSEELPLTTGVDQPTWWVYPGTSVVLTFDTPWDRGAFATSLRARVLGGGTATLSAGGVSVPLTATGRTWTAKVEGVSPAAPWTISVRADANAWVVIDQLSVGAEDPADLIGSPLTPVDVLPYAASTRTQPPETIWTGRPQPATGGVRQVAMPGTAQVDSVATAERLGRACSPLLLGLGGASPTRVAAQGATSASLAAGKPGYAHVGNALLVGTNVAATDDWQVMLDPRRRCGRAIWLYPGEPLAVSPKRDRFERQQLGVDEMEVTGAGFGADPAGSTTVAVILRRRGGNREELSRAEVSLPNAGEPVRRVVRLEPPLPAGTVVDVEMAATDPQAFVYLGKVILRESEGGGGVP